MNLRLSVLIFISFSLKGQSASTLMGARAAGMGYASAILSDGAALFNNPGAMAGNSASLFSAYEISPQLPGGNRMAAGLQFPMLSGVAGVGLFRFGDDLYSEQMLSAGFSNKFGLASLGIKANIIQYRAEGFGVKNAVSLDFGGRAEITPQITVAAYIVNLNQAEISPGERLSTRLVAALGIKLDENFLLATEVDKDLTYPATWKTGFEYSLYKKVFIRSGFNLDPSTFFAGLGAQIQKVKIDYALKFSVLGGSHQASVIMQLGKPKK